MGDFKKRLKRVMRYIIEGIPVVRPQVNVLSQNELLKGRNAFITGGTSGIGFEIAKAFINAGANVVITGRSMERVTVACDRLHKETGLQNKAFAIAMDNTKVSEFSEHLKKAIELLRGGKIDILVNNAGILGGHITNATEEEYDSILDTNLKGVFFFTKLVAEYIKENSIKANILNIASSSGICPANSAYCVSKWGIRGLTEGYARSLAPLGIVVNGIAPGPTATPMLLNDTNDLSHGKIPLGRYALPEEIANMAVIMVSNIARTVVGDIVYMTGGAGNITKENIRYYF